MTRKSKVKPGKLDSERLREIWTRVDTSAWLALCSELSPQSRFIRSGPNIKGVCPFHEDRGPSLVITPNKGLVKCFGCHKTFFHPVWFVASLLNKVSPDFAETLLFLRKRFALQSLIPDALYEQLREEEQKQRMKNKLCEFFCFLLAQAFADYPMIEQTDLLWAKPTVEYLLGRHLGEFAPNELRPAGEEGSGIPGDPCGVFAALCANQLLGIFPPRAVVAGKYGEASEEFKFFCGYFQQVTADTASGHGQIVLPYWSDPDRVSRFKLRRPSTEDKSIQYIRDKPDEGEIAGEFFGYYGLHYFRTTLGAKSADGAAFVDEAFVVEGEFDCLATIAQQIRRNEEDFVILALGGASAQPLDRLANFAIKKVGVIGDRDRGGENFAKQAMRQTRSDALSLKVFRWPDEYEGYRDPTDPNRRIVDPDDAVKWCGYPKWRRYLGTDDQFWAAWTWCVDQAQREIVQIAEADVKQRSRAAIEWGRLLRDKQEVRLFCKSMVDSGLDETVLVRDIATSASEDESEFVARVEESLRSEFQVMGLRVRGHSTSLELFHSPSKDHVVVAVGDPARALTSLAPYIGSVVDWIHEKVGAPRFLDGEGDGPALSAEFRSKRYGFYLDYALQRMSQGQKDLGSREVWGQGLHRAPDAAGEMVLYLVNGRDIYKQVHSAGKFEVSILPSPRDGECMFKVDDRRWLKSLHGPDDLTNADVNLAELYTMLRSLLSTGWGWRNVELDPIFLAGYILALPIISVLHRQTAIIVNAQAESGKSRFLGGLVGGKEFPRIHVVACAELMSGYTSAGVRSNMNGCRLVLCLDEFENNGMQSKKAKEVESVLVLTRDIVGQEPARIIIGAPGGTTQTFHLRFPMVCAGIHPLRDAASMSRFVQFELTNSSGRPDPVNAILGSFTEAAIVKLRHELAVGLFKHIPRVLEIQADVEKHYMLGGALPKYASSRFREMLFTPLIMLQLVAEDAQRRNVQVDLPDLARFAHDFSVSRKSVLTSTTNASETTTLFNTLLSSTVKRLQEGRIVTLRQMLGERNKLDEINSQSQGIFIDARQKWLVVVWDLARLLIFANNADYSNQSTAYLKSIAERSERIVKTEDVVQAETLPRLADYMGPGVKIGDVSVFQIADLIDGEAGGQSSPASSTPPVSGANGAADQTQSVDDITV